MAGSLLLSYFLLRKQAVARSEAFFFSLASMVSGIWLYEIVDHYAYGPEPLSIFIRELERIDFSGTSYGSHSIFPLLWSLIMISLPLSARKYMRVNRYFLFTFVGGLGVFAVWILLGFPQFFEPNWCSSWIPHCYAEISYPSSDRVLVGYLANSVSKLLVLSPALLFVPRAKSR